MSENMTYSGAGVDYESLDLFKRLAQLAGSKTAKNIERLGLKAMEGSRGESAYLIETPDCYLAQVEEGLGTKNLVADDMERLTGKSYYSNIAQDTVAMIVNDMITLGALPVLVAMHLAAGSSNWFQNETRCQTLINGWKQACDLAGCLWAGGETPILKDIISPDTVVLSGSALGIIKPKERLLTGSKIEQGDAIIFVASSGIHANGLTLARKMVDKLPEGYLTKLSDGRAYGETLLEPTFIYVGLVEDCLNAGLDIHYAVNITGHGWRKLMRASQPFSYRIEKLPPLLPIFKFIQEKGPVDDYEAFANFNMGAGFALYVSKNASSRVIKLSKSRGFFAWQAGQIEKSKEKKVFISSKNLVYRGETLGVR